MSNMARSGKRIAIVFHGLSGGGMERSMLRLASGLRDRGHMVDIVVQRCRGELVDEVPDRIAVYETSEQPAKKSNTTLGKIVRKTKKRRRALRLRADLLCGAPSSLRLFLSSDLKALRPLGRLEPLPGLVRYLRRQQPDAVLAAEPHYNALAVLARRVARVRTRIVLSERIQPSMRERRHGPWRHPYLKDFLRRTYLSADAIVAVSNGVADDLAKCSGIPRERIRTIYNPIVGPDITAMAEQPLAEPFFGLDTPPVVLAVGRLDPQKDYSTLVRAFARLRNKREARLLILGAEHRLHPLYQQEIMDLAAELGIAEDLMLPGYVNNPFAYMARAGVFVLSSTHEGLPGVLIQALACGCPTVSTDCPSGPREILENGRYGALVPVGDDAAMAAAIEQTLDKPIASEVLKARADTFSIDRAVDSYLQVLLRRDST